MRRLLLSVSGHLWWDSKFSNHDKIVGEYTKLLNGYDKLKKAMEDAIIKYDIKEGDSKFVSDEVYETLGLDFDLIQAVFILERHMSDNAPWHEYDDACTLLMEDAMIGG